MNHTVEYFASSDDSVRTILHEWNLADLEENSSKLVDSISKQFSVKAFDAKFRTLDSILTTSLGTQTLKDINTGFSEETVRDDVKWSREGGLNVYLLMFKRDGPESMYRQIRLITYFR
jgi:hypothetical protein